MARTGVHGTAGPLPAARCVCRLADAGPGRIPQRGAHQAHSSAGAARQARYRARQPAEPPRGVKLCTLGVARCSMSVSGAKVLLARVLKQTGPAMNISIGSDAGRGPDVGPSPAIRRKNAAYCTVGDEARQPQGHGGDAAGQLRFSCCDARGHARDAELDQRRAGAHETAAGRAAAAHGAPEGGCRCQRAMAPAHEPGECQCGSASLRLSTAGVSLRHEADLRCCLGVRGARRARRRTTSQGENKEVGWSQG